MCVQPHLPGGQPGLASSPGPAATGSRMDTVLPAAGWSPGWGTHEMGSAAIVCALRIGSLKALPRLVPVCAPRFKGESSCRYQE